jgi:hypothetical protein
LSDRLCCILTPPTQVDATAAVNAIQPSATKIAGQRHDEISAPTENTLLQAAGADAVNAMAKIHPHNAAAPSTPATTKGFTALLYAFAADMNFPPASIA